ncbi:AGE family epimerase/isomerase [Nakamurella silvestris]|nr:AGE family epimerase/isomerase [Nakamurella silvestris]
MSHRTTRPLTSEVLEQESLRLYEFARSFPHPQGGAAWLDERGRPDLTMPVHTWVTARMAHTYSLAALSGVEGAAELADIAVAGLTGPLRDRVDGGWYSSVLDGESPDDKSCYAHAFVVLAGASATTAGRPGGRQLLDEALQVWEEKFWEPAAGLYADTWNRAFSVLSDYRGINANMHAVEALLAAYDATGEVRWRDRALEISRRVMLEFAEPNNWRVPEHFDAAWQPVLEYNRERPDDPFLPYGATVGHALEWSRLLLHVEAAVGPESEPWLRRSSVALFDRAVEDGWAVDGIDGFVYTTGWDGRPVIRDRMHWVAAEGIGAAAALHTRTGEPRYAELLEIWWEYADRYLMDRVDGSWHHQLDSDNHPISTVWSGKPDVYHAVQATLIPRLPLAPGLAVALRDGLLDSRS